MPEASDIAEYVLGVFKRFIDHDADLLAQIQSFGQSMRAADCSWQFRLKDLYQFLKGESPIIFAIDYSTFRKAIYQSNINQQLSAWNSKVDVISNSRKINDSIYELAVPPSQ